MGFLDRLLGRKPQAQQEEPVAPAPECPHVALVAGWDNAEDIGDPAKVARYTCEACTASFSAEEGSRLRAQEAERVRRIESEGTENE